MATLNKLAIRGIRSFDDKQISVIEFFSPVTVIVGHNGSGKTTVIECLKYATTGDQPPNTRGGAFVHDPKMANEKEVKAQVKLRFNTASGVRMLAVRNLSVTVKKNNALTMKTLESILAHADGNADKGGKRGVISTKCAEMDAEIPQLLGVSKAVLENVIFCHQEDSYWPLAEPAALKKKFDDIFEATKYTKALDSIKSLRKDLVSDLKAERERLDSLSKEKSHADKLNKRVSDMNANISAKEIEYEEIKKEYDQLVLANQRFYDQATKFREMYVKLEGLQERKLRYQEDLDSAKENLQAVEGSDQEIQERLDNFDKHILDQKNKRRTEAGTLADLQDELSAARKTHVNQINMQGGLKAEEQAQEQRLADQETFIRETSVKYNLKGYDHPSLDKDKILQFCSRLSDLQRKQNTDTETLQGESRAKAEEYNTKSRKLHADLEAFKQQKANMRDRITSLQSNISSSEAQVDATLSLTTEVLTLQGDMEEKKRRMDKAKEDIKASNYEERVAEKTSKARGLEEQRDDLNAEFRSLSLQADSRARLDLKRDEMKSKKNELKNTLEINNPKFRKLVGTDARAESMEHDLDHLSTEKERECAELESAYVDANKALQQAETTLSNLNSQLKSKEDEVKSLDKKIRDDRQDFGTIEAACKEAATEISTRREISGGFAGSSMIYERMLKTGQTKKKCTACDRHLDDTEMVVFEKYLKDQMKLTSPANVRKNEQEIEEWEKELSRLQNLLPFEGSWNKLTLKEIPALKDKIGDQSEGVPTLAEAAQDASNALNETKKELKDIAVMKPYASTVSRISKDIERLTQEIRNLETDLESTGSSKTPDSVQEEIDNLTVTLRANEREKQALITEKERMEKALRTHESDLHAMQLRESDLKSKLRDRAGLEKRIEEMKTEIGELSKRSKEIDSKIETAQNPIKKLDEEHQDNQREFNRKITEAQHLAQDLNMSVDKLDGINRAIDRYVRNKTGKTIKECDRRIKELETEISQLVTNIEDIRDKIATLDKELNESSASMTNLRENLRVRKLMRDIADTQTEINSLDMEQAAKAKRHFEEKYKVEKQRETQMQSQYAHIGGELSSIKAQVRTQESDLKEFKDVSRRYKDQLVKVKMSDMANNDLEKYAKALDNAIMKYHSLKMEEVNDTMKHLWNKTYQGTDIDGIRIRSDVEGGASKRSYNYRVVMTKDQVEMDMRGRCSAGQKMLASIIIRLALADSFGQNCGILALDEPTNALDTENIDALASSLVDIINERKNHTNFQLIIITHDENFLRKLGQSDVMDYYWRVSRDSRQKSVIERQRFG